MLEEFEVRDALEGAFAEKSMSSSMDYTFATQQIAATA